MPELPDITVYIEALEPRVIGHRLERLQLNSLFLLRTATPPIDSISGQDVLELRRLGKRICFGFKDDLWLVLHLMIAGRLHWKERARTGTSSVPTKFSKNHLAAFQFDNGLLTLTEAGTQRRASLHLVKGEEDLRALDRGGLELFQKPDRKGGHSTPVSASSSSLIHSVMCLNRRITGPSAHLPIRVYSAASATLIQTRFSGTLNCHR